MSDTPAFADILEELENAEQLAEDAAENGELYTAEQKDDIKAYIEELLRDQLAPKIDGFAQVRKFRKERIEAYKRESDRLAKRAKNEEANLKWIEYIYMLAMEAHGKQKVSGAAYTISIRKAKEIAVISAGLKAEDFPDELCNIRTTREISKTKVYEALKAGQVIDGCSIGRTKFLAVN